ncbi:hypothetical protein QBC35DRAFT_474628 [Podospora australis]|uniref:Uncharacterized protein n=1 Tax=Podospora australis TaxID=1536484 RepID=A0AAN7AIN5_9PEZI|nr:hypothetical protein QBC35DRAFT_474628 [Podospora australis]
MSSSHTPVNPPTSSSASTDAQSKNDNETKLTRAQEHLAIARDVVDVCEAMRGPDSEDSTSTDPIEVAIEHALIDVYIPSLPYDADRTKMCSNMSSNTSIDLLSHPFTARVPSFDALTIRTHAIARLTAKMVTAPPRQREAIAMTIFGLLEEEIYVNSILLPHLGSSSSSGSSYIATRLSFLSSPLSSTESSTPLVHLCDGLGPVVALATLGHERAPQTNPWMKPFPENA